MGIGNIVFDLFIYLFSKKSLITNDDVSTNYCRIVLGHVSIWLDLFYTRIKQSNG